MALVSTTGTKSLLGMRLQIQTFSGQVRQVVYEGRNLFFASGRDNTLGSPTPPSQKQSVPGTFKDILWPVSAGARTISIDVRYTGAGTPPRLIVKANPSVGLMVDLTEEASASGSFVTIGPIAFTATADGVVRVWRERREYAIQEVNWDNLQVT